MFGCDGLVAETPFGLEPYWFSPGALSKHIKTRKTTTPTNGTRFISHHQPERPVSCNRRKTNPKLGKIITNIYKTLNHINLPEPEDTGTKPSTTDITKANIL